MNGTNRMNEGVMEYFEYLSNINNIQLNEQQRAAVGFDEGNALVLSTAGSGKTTVIISRAGRLLYENKCKRKILTITFSKMAAIDMKDRFYRHFGDKYRSLTEFSTIHAFSYKVVRDYFNKKNTKFEILQNNYHVLKEILKVHYSETYFNYVSEEEVESLSSAIGFVNNMMIDPTEYEKYGIEIKDFDKLCHKYKTYKSDNRLIDFDDMLIYACKIIAGSQYYRKMIKNTYQYVQIDEMQDTSKIQHEIIKLISKDNLFMVGDDDQSIYSFRGSYPDFMLNFKNTYPSGSVFYLDTNFRSDKNIVETAKKFIEKNKNRYIKSIDTINPAENEIKISKMNKRAEQCHLITNELKESNECTTGILYRNNISAVILANSLYENNIDFYLKEDKTKFFNSLVLQDVMSFLRLALNPRDRDAFAKIYYKSYTYFSKAMCKIVTDSPHEELSVFDILAKHPYFEHYVYDKIEQFRADINYINKLSPKDIIRFIKLDLEYTDYIDRMNKDGRINIQNAMHILDTLEEIGSYCQTTKDYINKIQNLQQIIQSASGNKGSSVTLTTIHSAKGLEYDRVYMIDNVDGEFPPDKKHMDSQAYEKVLEEERRVFYVGMTRAKTILNIISPSIPSLFVNELIYESKNTIETDMQIEQEVKHQKYGKGTVVDIKDGIVFIKFNKGNKTRSFDLAFILEKGIIERV